MSSVVRTTTGITISASASAPAQRREMPDAARRRPIDEQADDDRRRGQQDVVDEARRRREPAAAAEFGEVGAGEDADRRADQRADRAISRLPTIALSSPPALPGGGVICVNRRRAERAEARRRTACTGSRPARTGRTPSPASDISEIDAVDEQPAGVEAIIGCARRQVRAPSRFASRISSSFASASTMEVMRNRIRPSSISADGVQVADRLGELVGERRRDAVARARAARRQAVRVADHERHRHRLAERAARGPA